MPKLQIPTPLRPQTGGIDALDVTGTTVREALEAAIAIHPALGERLFEKGDIRRFVNVFVNDEDIRYLDDLQTLVHADDVVSIIPAVAGG